MRLNSDEQMRQLLEKDQQYWVELLQTYIIKVTTGHKSHADTRIAAKLIGELISIFRVTA